MAKHTSNINSHHRKKDENEFNFDLFVPPVVDDWSRAIHHDLNIKRRTCTTFIPKSSASSDQNRDENNIRCGCNRLRREHSWDVLLGNDTVWDKKIHTKAAYNNAYGHISQTNAKYIRCDIDTNPKILAKFMYDVWRVKEPKLMMCIIGGAKYFKLSERLQKEFIKGIIQAALKADGWIITTGFKTGVVELVGEAIHDHKVTNSRSQITAIGCSKWGALKYRERLVSTKSSLKSKPHPPVDSSKQEKGQQIFEPNHTHFIFLDDGMHFGYETGDYRTRLVVEASHLDKRDVPVVTIVVEGGPDTLLTIYNDLRTGIPIVLIDGSGRVPNLLATFLTRTESMINRMSKDNDAASWKQEIDIKDQHDIEKLKTKFLPYVDEILDGLKDISKGGKTSEKEINKLFNYVLYCLQPAVRSKIQIYSLDSDLDLDDTIFLAIIQAQQQKSSKLNEAVDRERLLLLALAWDAIEIAKEYIIKDDLTNLSDDMKENVFFEALLQDRPHFVNKFIKLNFDLPKMFYQKKINQPWVLIWEKLEKLYNEDKKSRDRLYLLHKYTRNNGISTPHQLDRILRSLIGDYMKSIYTRLPPGLLGRFQLCCQYSHGVRVADNRTVLCMYGADNESEVPDPEQDRHIRQVVLRDLFFWSLLTNRVEMTEVILSHMETRICAALIASKVFKSNQNDVTDNESKVILYNRAQHFEEYAIECLKCCYNCDEERACEIAIRRIDLLGGVSCLQVASDANDKHFVGEPCCDQLLNNIWHDKMVPFKLTVNYQIRFLLSIITFGLLAPFLIPFRKEQLIPIEYYNKRKRFYEMTVNESIEKEELIPQNTRRLKNRGINYSDTYMKSSIYCSDKFLTYFRNLKHFHEAPLVKFTYTTASYIFFLLLFSYYLLFEFNIPTSDIPSIHWTEILVIIIVSSMLAEDIRQFLCQDNRSFIGKLSNYFIKQIFSSSIRITSYVLFYLGLILRFTNASSNENLNAARIILAYDLEMWFIRSLAFLAIAKNMGPKLVMIRKMVIDLFFFTYIILTIMIAYGVTSRAIYKEIGNPDNSTIEFTAQSIFRNVMYPTYYLMYGAMDKELTGLDQNPEYAPAIATQVLLAFHMLVVNILLINLLIAMFSFTFERVQSHTDLVWHYERYLLIREYFDRPPLFPPLIIITHIFELIKLILRHLPRKRNSKKRTNQSKIFKMVGAQPVNNREWSEFESYATNLYARNVVSGQSLSTTVLASLKVRENVPQTSFDISNNSQLSSDIDIRTISDEMASIKKVVTDLHTYAAEMNRCMQWMMDAMERVKMSREPKPRLRPPLPVDDIREIDE